MRTLHIRQRDTLFCFVMSEGFGSVTCGEVNLAPRVRDRGGANNTFSDLDKCITSGVVSDVVIIYCCIMIPYYEI
jgi:hypothetical protein